MIYAKQRLQSPLSWKQFHMQNYEQFQMPEMCQKLRFTASDLLIVTIRVILVDYEIICSMEHCGLSP